MKKPTAKERVLERNPTLEIKEDNGEYVVILVTKSGRHPLGRGKDEDAAWRSAMVYYGLK